MGDKIKKLLKVKLWLAVIGLALFGFTSLFSGAKTTHSQWGYDCMNNPWILYYSSSVTVQNLTTGNTVSAYADVYNSNVTRSITVNYGDLLRVSVDGSYSGDPSLASYGGSVMYNNSETYFYYPTSLDTGAITAGGPATFIMTDCMFYTATATVNINVNPPPAPTATISAASTSVAYNTGTNITWSSANASRCEVKKNGTLVSGWTATNSTQPTGNLTSTTTYAVICYNASNTASNTASVTINVPSPDISVSCTPSLVVVNQNSSGSFSLIATSLNGFTGPVTWSTASALPTGASLVYTNNGASLTSGGSATATASISTALTTPAGTYNFIFTTTSSVSSKTCGTVQLQVRPRPTATISAAATSLAYGGSTTINWSSTNATGCTVTKDGATVVGWTGATGSQPTPALYATTTYAVTCSGDGGTSALASVTITVANAPTATISATSPSIDYSAATDITWGSSNATNGCVLKKDGVTIATWTGTTGTQSTGQLYTNTTYSAICYNSVNYASNTATVTIAVASAPTATISAASISIAYGGATDITWGSSNANAGCVLKKDGVTITSWTGTSGTQPTGALTANTTYSATCSNKPGASATANVTVSVAGGPTATISAAATSLSYSGSTTISWNSTNATTCVLKKDGVTIAGWTGVSGSQPTGSLTATTTYTATCSNSAGTTASNSVTITVDPAPTATISATSTSLPYSGSTTITWGSTNSSGCVVKKDGVTIAGWTGISGSQPTGNLYANTTYSVTCNNSVGYASNAATVTITVASAPTATISAASINIAYGGSTNITWGSTNATRCVLQKDGVTIATWTGVSGTQPTGALYVSTTYSATCYNSVDYPSNTATVRVNLPTPSISVSCTPATYTVTQGSTASFALQSTSQNGFSGPVTWSLAGSAPTNSTLTYNNNGASLAVGGSATTTAILQTQYTTPTGTYNFTFNTSSTAATQSCGVQLIVSGAAPIITLTANGSLNNLTVNYYDYVTIAWSTTNATSCTISPTGWTGTSGSQVVGPVTGNLSYSATCTSSAGLNAYANVSITVNNPNISNATVDTIGYTLSTDQNTLTTSATGKRPCYSPCTRDSYFDVTINGEVQKVTDAGTTITQWSGNIYYPQITSLSSWFWPARTQDTGAVSTPNPVTPLNISSWANGNYRFCATVSGSTTAVYPDVSTTYSKCTAVFTINNRDFALTCSIMALSLTTITTQGSVSLSTSANTGFNNAVVFSNSISPSTGTLPTISYTNNGQVPNATTTALITITSSTTPATYTITFTGTGGGVSKSCNVQLNLTPSVSISATKTALYNGTASVTWTSTFATACSVTSSPVGYNWTGTAGTQSATGIKADTTFTASCTGPGGSASASDLTQVGPTGDLKCNSTSDGPCNVDYGTSTILAWSSSNATACSVKSGRTTLTVNTNTSGSITSTAITSQVQYDLVCTRDKVATDVVVDSVIVQANNPVARIDCIQTTQQIKPGETTSFSLQITSTSYNGDMVISDTGKPANLLSYAYLPSNTVTLTANPSQTSYVTFNITSSSTTVAGTYNLIFTGTYFNNTATASCNASLIVEPNPPTSLTASNGNCGTITFNWVAPNNVAAVTNYKIIRTDVTPNTVIAQPSAGVTTYNYSPPYFASAATYVIKAVYNNTESAISDSIQIALVECRPLISGSLKGIIKARRAESVNWEPAGSTENDISTPFAFADGGRFRVGDLAKFQIRVYNNGTVPLINISVTDTPKNVLLSTDTTISFSALNKDTPACGTVDTNVTNSNQLQISIPSLDPSQACSITFIGTVMNPTSGSRPYYFQNKASITGTSKFDANVTVTSNPTTPAYSIDVDTGIPTRTETSP